LQTNSESFQGLLKREKKGEKAIRVSGRQNAGKAEKMEAAMIQKIEHREKTARRSKP